MLLYISPGACSLASHIVLCELGLDFSVEKVDLASKKTESGKDYLAISPKGYVPALDIGGGDIITENIAVMAYITSRKPEVVTPKLDSRDFFKYLEWLAYVNTEIHKGFGVLFRGDSPEGRALLDKKLELLSKLVGEREFVAVNQFTPADAYLFVVLGWAGHLKVKLPENLQLYHDRIAKRPSVVRAMECEGLLSKA